jgi:quinone-modifying oxidoreductase subunit QmoC
LPEDAVIDTPGLAPPGFLAEVEAQIPGGEWVRMCTQCGACSGSCPLGPHWEHPPQELFHLVRANRRDAVLGSSAPWMCTACYSCTMRCPRGIPVTALIQGLAGYAHRAGAAPEAQPTRRFAARLWAQVESRGRVDEGRLALSLHFADGFRAGVRSTLAMRHMGLRLLRAGRLGPLSLVRGDGVRDRKGLRAMLARAREIEAARRPLPPAPGAAAAGEEA